MSAKNYSSLARRVNRRNFLKGMAGAGLTLGLGSLVGW